MLKGFVLVCRDNYQSNKSLRQVRRTLLGRNEMSSIRISNHGLNPMLGNYIYLYKYIIIICSFSFLKLSVSPYIILFVNVNLR